MIAEFFQKTIKPSPVVLQIIRILTVDRIQFSVYCGFIKKRRNKKLCESIQSAFQFVRMNAKHESCTPKCRVCVFLSPVKPDEFRVLSFNGVLL